MPSKPYILPDNGPFTGLSIAEPDPLADLKKKAAEQSLKTFARDAARRQRVPSMTQSLIDDQESQKEAIQPFRHWLAEVGSLVPAIPALAGLAGAAGETYYSTLIQDIQKGGIHPLTPLLPPLSSIMNSSDAGVFSDRGAQLQDNFLNAISTGIDKDLLDLGLAGRARINKTYGVGEAKGAINQIARLSAMLFPLPFKIPPGASALTRAAGHTGAFVSPLVTAGPGFATRAGAQAVIGTGIDQGIRALIDNPEFPLIIDDPIFGDESDKRFLPTDFGAGNLFMSEAIAEEFDELSLEDGTTTTLVSDPTFDGLSIADDPFSGLTLATDPVDGEYEYQKRIDLEDKILRQEEADTITFWATVAGAITGSVVALKSAQKLAARQAARRAPFGEAPEDPSTLMKFLEDVDPTTIVQRGPISNNAVRAVAYIHNLPGVVRRGGSDFGHYIDEQFGDRQQGIANAMADLGLSREAIDHVVASSHTNPLSIAGNAVRTGELGQGFLGGNLGGGRTHSIIDLDNEFIALGPENQRRFQEVMLARTELADRAAGLSPSSLWARERTATQLREVDELGMDVPEVRRLVEKHEQVYNTLLDYGVHMTVLTDTVAEAMRARFRNADGSIAYMPLYSANRSTFFKRLARRFGSDTSPARQLEVQGEYHARGGDRVAHPLGPEESIRQYMIHTVNNAITSAYHARVLHSLSGVRVVDGEARLVRVNEKGLVEDLVDPREHSTARNTSFLGVGEIGDDIQNIHINVDSRTAPKGIKSGSINDIRRALNDDVYTVQHQGKLWAYHVPDPVIKAALDLNPQLGPVLFAFNQFKKLFTLFTTGGLSAFAPKSLEFGLEQAALTTTGRTKGGLVKSTVAGLKTVPQTATALVKLMHTGFTDVGAQFLARRIARHTGMDKQAPDFMLQWEKILEDRFRRSLVQRVRAETGILTSSMQTATFGGTAEDFAASLAPSFASVFGPDQLGAAWKMWKVFQTSFHDAPAFGAINKRIGEAIERGEEITPKVIREATDHSKTVVGDMRRIGASKAAVAFNAAVPFSAAMIQSWRALGGAAFHGANIKEKMKSFTKFSTGAAVLIGAPTAMEMLNNLFLSITPNADGSPRTWVHPDDPTQKEWTYLDYYWNGYTLQQRTYNRIVMLSDRPPWEAAIWPISPEWGLFRGATIAALDTVFGMSAVGDNVLAQLERGEAGMAVFWASLARVLDVPIPPPLAAALTYLGVNTRVGFELGQNNDPENPGPDVTFVRSYPLPGGERLTRFGTGAAANSTLDIKSAEMLADIFGSGAALYIPTVEGFHSGYELEGGSIASGVEGALAGFSDGLAKQASYLQPMWKQSLRPSPNDSLITRDLFGRRTALEALSKDAKLFYTMGLDTAGNADVPQDDPIIYELSADAERILSDVGKLNGKIADARKAIAAAVNATRLDGKPATRQEINQYIDARQLEMTAIKAQQLGMIRQYEVHISEVLNDRYKRAERGLPPIKIDLLTLKPRAKLLGSSIFQELQ